MRKLSVKFPFGRQSRPDGYEINEVYQGLRNQILTLDPKELDLDPGQWKVWGVLMETGYAEAAVTLVAIADGTASLYFSNGGGILGAGGHEGPAKAAHDLIAQAGHYVADCERGEAYPLPKVGNTRFYLLTFDGVFSTEAPEADLGYNRHKLSPLFHAAHALIGEIRIIDEKRTNQDP